MDDIKSVNSDELRKINEAIYALEKREERLDNSKSTNPKYLRKKREKLLLDYQNLLMQLILKGYTYDPKCRRGIVCTITGDLQDAIDRNTLRLKQ